MSETAVRWRVVVLSAALAVSVASTGCSEGGSGGVNVGGPTGCGQVQACGGDPVGTWALTKSCITAAGQRTLPPLEGCPGFSIDVNALESAGTLTFNADGTYALEGFLARVSLTFVFPPVCSPESCESQEANISSAGVLESVSCSGTSSCSCAVTSSETDSGTGQFTVSGTDLVLDGATVLGTGGPFCVEGTHLHLISPPYDGSTVNGDRVGVRQ